MLSTSALAPRSQWNSPGRDGDAGRAGVVEARLELDLQLHFAADPLDAPKDLVLGPELRFSASRVDRHQVQDRDAVAVVNVVSRTLVSGR